MLYEVITAPLLLSHRKSFGHIKMRAITVIFLAAWASMAQSANLSVRVQGAPADGMLVLQVYDSPNTFGDFRDPAKEIRTPIEADAVYET